MSGGPACNCPESKKPARQREWVVFDYKCNYSAFNGYKYTRSDYSSVYCRKCERIWRTKAYYVQSLKILNDEEIKKELQK